jgi:hypothetical protein
MRLSRGISQLTAAGQLPTAQPLHIPIYYFAIVVYTIQGVSRVIYHTSGERSLLSITSIQLNKSISEVDRVGYNDVRIRNVIVLQF